MEDRCTEAKKFQRIDDAFRNGDLEALRAAVDDPGVIPNGLMPRHHRSVSRLCDLSQPAGVHPHAARDRRRSQCACRRRLSAADRGALLHASRAWRDTRTDVAEIIRLLLAFGTDPNQRGINDYTPLHMAVAERNAAAVRLLLDGGADPDLRTRIDSYETPLEIADALGFSDIAAMLR